MALRRLPLILELDVIIDVSLWSTVEPGIGITAASIATLRPLLQTFLSRLGLAPAPMYNVPRPLRPRDRLSDVQYTVGWFRPRHRAPSLAHIQSSLSPTVTPAHHERKRWFSSGGSRTNESAHELTNEGLRTTV